MKEIIAIIAAVVLAVLTFVLLNSESDRTKELQIKNNQIEIQTSSIQQNKRELEEELEELKNNKIQKEKGIGSLLLVFIEIDERFSGEIVPALSKNSIRATLCITESNLPYILNLDLKALLDDGWQTALYWDGSYDFEEWYNGITDILADNNISIPTLVCVDYSSYVTSINNTAESLGFSDIIINFNNVEKSIENSSNSINIINGHPWYTTASSTALSTLNFVNSQLAFFVGINGEELAYESLQFSAMLNTALSKQSEKRIIITTPAGSIAQIKQNEEEYMAAIEGYEEKVESLEKAIAELDAEIDKIYNEHFDDN